MTMLTRYSPFVTSNEFRRHLDRLFDDVLPNNRVEGTDEASSAVWSPRLDISESDDGYSISVDLPGLTKDDLNINFHENVLTISGERKTEQQEDRKNYYCVERLFGHFYRSVKLPKAVAAGKISATFENGVLNVFVPKLEESKPVHIKVK